MELEFFSTNQKDTGFYQCKRNAKVLKNIFLHVYENKSTNCMHAKKYILS